MSHPSRRFTTSTSGQAAEEQAPVVAQPAAMEYEQANVEAFEAASKHVSELLSVNAYIHTHCLFIVSFTAFVAL